MATSKKYCTRSCSKVIHLVINILMLINLVFQLSFKNNHFNQILTTLWTINSLGVLVLMTTVRFLFLKNELHKVQRVIHYKPFNFKRLISCINFLIMKLWYLMIYFSYFFIFRYEEYVEEKYVQYLKTKNKTDEVYFLTFIT